MLYDMPFDENHPRTWRNAEIRVSDEFYAIEIGYNLVPCGFEQNLKRDVFILHYITEGEGEFSDSYFDKNYAYVVHPNELEVFKAQKDCGYETYWIMFGGRKAEEVIKICGIPEHNKVFAFTNNKECAKILNRNLFEITPENEYEESYLLNAALYEIISVHMKSVKTFDEINPAFSIKNFIEQNYQKEINFNMLAKRMNYSRSHLYKIFKKSFDVSPKEYLTETRINKSKEFLRDSSESFSISEIAYMTGYNDPLYFSRLFHRKTGLSPSEYKREHTKAKG